MKRLKGSGCCAACGTRSASSSATKSCWELDHGRTLSIRRESVGGEDGVTLLTGIDRADRTADAHFVIRAPNFGQVHLSVEQAK